MRSDLKRQNFDITPEQEAEMNQLKEAIDAPSAKNAYMWAIHLSNILAGYVQKEYSIVLVHKSGKKQRLVIPELEKSTHRRWMYLVERPHPWRHQFYVKGRRLLASTVWSDMIANKMSREEAAGNWDLPVGAIDEIVEYCEANKALLKMEAEEENYRLQENKVPRSA